jgi:lipoate---protein ligase
MRLRVIDGGVRSAVGCQALWHGVASSLRPGDDPALVFVTPGEAHISIGFHQNAAVELDLEACRAHGIGVLRRRLGGGAVLLDERQLIFHVIWPREQAPRRLALLYPRFLAPLLRAYRELGIAAAYRPANDIQVEGRKLAGAAAAEIGEAAVVGSMVLFDFDGALMARLLCVPDVKMRDKLGMALADYVTSLRRLLAAPPDRNAMRARLMRAASEEFGVQASVADLTAAEAMAVDAEAGSLSRPDWTHRAGRKFVAGGVKLAAGAYLAQGVHKAPGGLIRVALLARDGCIADLEIDGDFTCRNPDGIAGLARQLVGLPLETAALERAVSQAILRLDLDLPGIAPADLAQALGNARRDGCCQSC